MMIRALRPEDIDKIHAIHEKFYKYEFEFPDFFKNYTCSFVVIEDDEIITAGGVREIAELVAVTNKDANVRKRYKAFFQMLDCSFYVAGRSGHDQIHAFIQDPVWEKILNKVGFIPTVGKSLVINL